MENHNAVKSKQVSEDLEAKMSSFHHVFDGKLKQLDEAMSNLNAAKSKQISEDLEALISKNI